MRGYLVISASLLMFASGPALATPCADEVATLQRRLDSTGAETVTGKEPPGGATTSNSPKALDKPQDAKPSDPDTKATAQGISEARDLLQKASAADKAGDAQKCRDTVLQAKEKAGSLP